MYEEHPEFEAPPSETVLWRYMDFTKFVSLLDRGALFFARADMLGDPFEGSYSPINVALRPHLYEELLDLGLDDLSGLGQMMKGLRRFHLVNCWHENKFESEAMWKLYSSERKGVAIKTTFGSLIASLQGDETVYIGRVKYVDYQNTFIPERNAFSPYLHKRKSFEHEREVRAIHMSVPQSNEDSPFQTGPDVTETGLYLEVDLGELIQEVVIAPDADAWFVELAQSVAAKFGVEAPITRSTLADSPVW